MIQSEITGTGNVRQINRSFKIKTEAVSKTLVDRPQDSKTQSFDLQVHFFVPSCLGGKITVLRQPPLFKSKKHIYGQFK